MKQLGSPNRSLADRNLNFLHLNKISNLRIKVDGLTGCGNGNDYRIARLVSYSSLTDVRFPPASHSIDGDSIVTDKLDRGPAPDVAVERARLNRLGAKQPVAFL